MDDPEEHALAAGLRAGDPAAWRAVYDRYAPRVWRGVARLIGPRRAEIDDLTQETFLALARSARTYDPARGPLWPWVWGVARLQVALYLRKQARAERGEDARTWLAAGTLTAWLEGRETLPADHAERAEAAELVRSVLRELPDDYGRLLSGKYCEGHSVAELAAQERCSAEAIRSKLARARDKFRALFDPSTRLGATHDQAD